MTREELTARLAGRSPGLAGLRGENAVLVPVVEGEAGRLSLLFEVRADTLNSQPGEVCFPGGRVEPGETPLAAALRETGEELGVTVTRTDVLAPLDRLLHQSGYLLHPFLAVLPLSRVENLRPNPPEVKETFMVPLDFFRTTQPEVYHYALRPDVPENFPYDRIGFPHGYRWKSGQAEVPIWNWEGHSIWGITGRVVKALVALL